MSEHTASFENESAHRATVRLHRLSTLVALAVVALLAAFYGSTIHSAVQVNEQVNTIESGPYLVSIEAGRVETRLVQLQTLAERPTYVRTDEALDRIEQSYAEVDEVMQASVGFIVERHINKDLSAALSVGYDELLTLQEDYLALCRNPETTDAEVRAYFDDKITPLINDLLEVDASIFDVSTARVEQLCENVDELGQRNIVLASALMAAVIASLAMYLALLHRQRKQEAALRSDLHRALNMAQSANKAKSDFLSSMSHDIRTPMNAIVGLTAIARSHLDEPGRVGDCLERIAISSKHLLSLINDVLDMGKIESGKIALSHERFSFPEFVSGIVTIVQPQAKAKNLALDIHVNNVQQERVVGDSIRLEQVLLNLLSNAVKYTPEGGTVQFSITEEEGEAEGTHNYRFTVRDTGIGMDPDFVKVVFEPFERERNATTERTEGAGLGMAITKSIVEMMGGTITVESTLGEGSTFTVLLPLRFVADAGEYPLLPQLEGKRVLVVDDDRAILESTAEIMQELGLAGSTAQSGGEAIALVVEAHHGASDFHAVIVDWIMPDMDGVETIRHLRRELGESIPIILLTAYDWSEIEDEARAAGASAFIAKPLFKSRLYHALAALCFSDAAPEDTCSGEAQQAPLAGRVLLVEDNELNREIATELIGVTGAQVEQACDGVEAVDMLLAAPDGYYDLVFMDMQMPRMNGIQATVVTRDKLAEAGRPCPAIVAMTANAFNDDRDAALGAGMSGFLTKPINLKELDDTLRAYLHPGR